LVRIENKYCFYRKNDYFYQKFNSGSMKIEQTEQIINLSGNSQKLIEMIISEIQYEFELYCQKLSSSSNLFQFNERALVGLLVNSIIRNDVDNRFIILQEFCVYNKHELPWGRADLFIFDSENDEYYLFEVKKPPFIKEKADEDWEDEETEKYLIDTVLGQAREYYEAEKIFYKKKPTYLGALVFEGVYFDRDKEKYISNLVKYEPKTKDYFYTFFHSDDSPKFGLAMYGLIKKAK
jgi:hypothetical protein